MGDFWVSTLGVTTLVASVALFAGSLTRIVRDWLELIRTNRTTIEKVRLRETQLRYSSAIDSHARQHAIDLVSRSLRILDQLDDNNLVREESSVREGVRELRRLEYAQLEALMNTFDEDWGETDLARLRGLEEQRRRQLESISETGEASQIHD